MGWRHTPWLGMDCSNHASQTRFMLGSLALKLKDARACSCDQDAGVGPLFPPHHPSIDQAKAAIRDVIERDPTCFGLERARWTLTMIRDACPWLEVATISGVRDLLDRLNIAWKRGQDHILSPDPAYDEKKEMIAQVIAKARAAPEEIVVVYQDEITLYRQPSCANVYAVRGRGQPRVERSHQANTITRYAATLDRCSGKVIFRRAARIGIKELVKLYQDLHRHYSAARVIYVVQDNWPIHVHPDVLVALQRQTMPYVARGPAHWRSEASERAKKAWGGLELPIQIVPLPTYASWLNPIEKLWRWLKQEIVHHHRLAHDLATFRQKIDDFLATFAGPSPALLRYVGLELPS